MRSLRYSFSPLQEEKSDAAHRALPCAYSALPKPRALARNGAPMIAPSPLKPKELNRLVARILVAKPDATADDVRRLLPALRGEGEASLTQKINSLSGRARTLAPAAQASRPRKHKR
jgi:hypothetical protein